MFVRAPTLRSGQLDGKDGMLGRRFARDGTAMRPNNLLSDGETQPSTAAIGRTRCIQAIELLKDHLELWLRDRIALVYESYAYATVTQTPGLDRDSRAFIAIGNSVFHDVVEYASHLVAVHEHRQVLADINLGFLVLFVENGIELIGHLRQQ